MAKYSHVPQVVDFDEARRKIEAAVQVEKKPEPPHRVRSTKPSLRGRKPLITTRNFSRLDNPANLRCRRNTIKSVRISSPEIKSVMQDKNKICLFT
jgi:hypothetical protein